MARFLYCGRLSSAQLVPLQAPKHRPIIGPHPVEQTAFQRDIKDNGYKSVFTNFLAGTSKEQVVDKGIRQKSTKEWTHSLMAVPFVRGHRSVFSWTPRNTCVYTSHPMFVTATSGMLTGATGTTLQQRECVLRRPPIGRSKIKLQV